jgi:hypothetical protein
MLLREYLQLTDSISDAEFESLFAQACRVRSARNEAIAVERQMHTATAGLSTRYAIAQSAAGVRQNLIASYAAAGLSAQQIEARLRELQSQPLR